MNHPFTGLQYASVCSGIEAVSVAWQPLGITPVWFAEIEPFPCAVLAHHYPEVPNLGDMALLAEKVLSEHIPAPPILIGGTPCQAFSIAGLRAGLADPRGVLSLKYVELANAIDQIRCSRNEPESIIVWENVPGVLSDKGNAFGCFLAALAGEEKVLEPPRKTWSHAGVVLGPQRTIAWRILDAQYFGVAQRRRRVFLVASARLGFDPAAVLFEPEGMRRDSPPDRSPGQIACAYHGTSADPDDGLEQLHVFTNTYGMANGQGGAEVSLECCPTLTCNHDVAFVVYEPPELTHSESVGPPDILEDGVVRANSITPESSHKVRRLLPSECERLQGLPNGYTRIARRYYATKRVSRSRPDDLWAVSYTHLTLPTSDLV